MSRPVDSLQIRQLLLDVTKCSTAILEAVSSIEFAAVLNQDQPTARRAVGKEAARLALVGYRVSRIVASHPDGTPVTTDTDPVVLPPLPRGAELDRMIYRGACQHISDVARFTGNLGRISDPETLRKTAEVLRDWAVLLAAQMDAHVNPSLLHR